MLVIGINTSITGTRSSVVNNLAKDKTDTAIGRAVSIGILAMEEHTVKYLKGEG